MSTLQEIIIQKFGSVNAPGMQPAKNAFVSVMEINTFEEFVLATIYIGVFYYANYFIFGGNISLIQGIIFYTNPIPRTV